MRRYIAVLSLLLVCLPGLAAKKKQVDPRDTLAYSHEYVKAGRKYLIGLNFSDDKTARIYTYKVLKSKCAPVGTPFSVEAGKDSVSFINVAGSDYILFSYLGEVEGELVWTRKAVSFDFTRFEMAEFSGKALDAEAGEFRIEGFSGTSLRENTDALTEYLDSLITNDSRLVVLPEEVYLTDKTVEWWLENNPKALTTAKKVNMASLPQGCSATDSFSKAQKEQNQRFQVASVNLRGYTLVIVRTIKTDTYTLVWAEPAGTRKADRRLVNLYFADANTLAMVYYKGGSMLKYRIGLGTGTIVRQ